VVYQTKLIVRKPKTEFDEDKKAFSKDVLVSMLEICHPTYDEMYNQIGDYSCDLIGVF
jgi:hypothetical protein